MTMPMHNLEVAGRRGATRSVMGDVHKHIFPSTLFTDEGS